MFPQYTKGKFYIGMYDDNILSEFMASEIVGMRTLTVLLANRRNDDEWIATL